MIKYEDERGLFVGPAQVEQYDDIPEDWRFAYHRQDNGAAKLTYAAQKLRDASEAANARSKKFYMDQIDALTEEVKRLTAAHKRERGERALHDVLYAVGVRGTFIPAAATLLHQSVESVNVFDTAKQVTVTKKGQEVYLRDFVVSWLKSSDGKAFAPDAR